MAATDVVSYDLARQALSIGPVDTSRKVLLESAIEAVSQRMDELCGPIVQRTVTEIIEVPRWERVTDLRITGGPVTSITSVKSYEDGVETTLTAETLTVAGDYLAELAPRVRPDGTSQMLSGRLLRRSSFSDWWWTCGTRIQVVYTAGRYATTAAVADRFTQAALIALRSLWRTYQSQVATASDGDYAAPFQAFPSVAIPAAALELVAADRVHVVGIA